MRKKAQEIFDIESRNVLLAQNPHEAKEAVEKLIALAGILDSMGAQADADKVDAFIKEAAGLLDFFSGMLGGAATTKDQEGEYFGTNVLDAFRKGDWSKVLDKETLVPVITHAIVTGGISLMTGEIIEALTQKVPGFSLIKDSTFTKMAISGALTYAITKSDFVSKLVDGLISEVEKMFGMKRNEQPVTPKPAATPAPVQTPPVSQKTEPKPEDGSTQSFQVAAPGAKV